MERRWEGMNEQGGTKIKIDCMFACKPRGQQSDHMAPPGYQSFKLLHRKANQQIQIRTDLLCVISCVILIFWYVYSWNFWPEGKIRASVNTAPKVGNPAIAFKITSWSMAKFDLAMSLGERWSGRQNHKSFTDAQGHPPWRRTAQILHISLVLADHISVEPCRLSATHFWYRVLFLHCSFNVGGIFVAWSCETWMPHHRNNGGYWRIC